MTELRIDGLAKSFAGVPALRGASLEVAPGRVHCLLGGNGSGKSTLVKVLAGVYRADAGTVTVGGESIEASAIDPGWARAHDLWFVHQDLAVFPTSSVAENLAAGRDYPLGPGRRIRWRELHARSRDIAKRFHLEVDPRTPLGALRPAQRTMVAIARALHQCEGGTGIIVLDEPTAALPEQEARFLTEAIRRYADDGHALIFVTHRLNEVDEVADDVTVLRDGVVIASQPATLSRDQLAELIAGEAAIFGGDAPEPTHRGRDVLTVRTRGPELGPTRELTVREGEIVGIAGRLGAGRSRLLRSIFGAQRHEYEISVDGHRLRTGDMAGAIKAGVAYVPESRDTEGLFASLDVRENLSAVDISRFRTAIRLDRGREAALTRDTMKAFLVRAASDSQPIMALSGGNRQKVLLARWLRTNPRLLLLDDPTQGVDVGARAEIHRMIRASTADGAAAVVVSSDFEELEQLADRVIILTDGEITTQLTGAAIEAARITHLTLTDEASTGALPA